MKPETVPCVMCREGLVYNPVRKRFEACTVCGGTQLLTPNTICQCGRSCTTEEDGVWFCGQKECLTELLRPDLTSFHYPGGWDF